MKSPLAIVKPKVLLVEGKDECNFFEAVLESLSISGVQTVDAGKSNFPANFDVFLNSAGFPRVQIYAVVRDADHDRDSAFESIKYQLNRTKQPCPTVVNTFTENPGTRVGVFIMPGDANVGMLEDLCLATVDEHPAIPKVLDYMAGLRQCLAVREPADAPKQPGVHYYPSNESKAKAQVFLAAMHEIQREIGSAALADCWNLAHPALKTLNTFLEHFRD